MKAFIYFSIIFIAQSATAQFHSMLSESHYWRGVVYGWGTNDYYQHVDGDTTIAFNTYKKLYSSSSLNGTQYLMGMLREELDSGKVYALNGTESLLYDFSLEVGESTTIHGAGAEMIITITDVDSVMVGNELRKRLTFQDAWGPAFWIDGVGSSYGPFDAALGPIADYGPQLQCFYANNSLSWSNPESSASCDIQLSTDDFSELNIEVSPNPFGDEFIVRTNYSGNENLELIIYDLAGRSVYQQSLRGLYQQIVRLPGLECGLYLLTLSQARKVAFVKLEKK
jgi:Secretion system C-terminal sorting domain